MRIALVLTVVVAAIVVSTAWQHRGPAPFGFTEAGAIRHSALEPRFLRLPSPERIAEANRFFAASPHLAGSHRDRELAEHVRDQFNAFGLAEVGIATHEVLLPWPEETSVEMVAPRSWRASMREDPIPGDVYTEAPAAQLGLPYHAYSDSGEVTARVVYAGSGNPEDYERLAGMGVSVAGAIVLVRYSVPYSYRGGHRRRSARR